MQSTTETTKSTSRSEKPSILANDEGGTYVTFDLSGESLGVEVRHVREILDRVNVNRIPNARGDVEGIIDIRGESIPIVDMGQKLGLPRLADCEDTRIIVFEVGQDEERHPVGVFADRVRDVTRITNGQIESPREDSGADWQSEDLIGLVRHNGLLILILDIQKVFGDAAASGSFGSEFF